MATPLSAATLDDLLTTSQAAQILGVSRQRVGVLISEGRLGATITFAGRHLVTRAAVAGFQRQPPVRPGLAAENWAKNQAKPAQHRRKSNGGKDLKNLAKSAESSR